MLSMQRKRLQRTSYPQSNGLCHLRCFLNKHFIKLFHVLGQVTQKFQRKLYKFFQEIILTILLSWHNLHEDHYHLEEFALSSKVLTLA